jgi:hypothetical protein
MSKRNGDKARAQKERKKKLLRRAHTLEIRKGLASKSTESVAPNQGEAESKTNHVD